MSRYTRPPNTSLFIRNVADATRSKAVHSSWQAPPSLNQPVS
ncbi:SRSF12 isoform 3 [Pan troglodytes]|uniref:Serine and arginine rich splicing factor 12 n=3 Tax=Hominidae TaxID=9604 RepID=E5RFT0_HUMAN|nr:SRSF12 isoform 3 [Pan troglodytes]PNJ60201.1 SRSF12 isoform 5 [Pongo abelii]